MTIIIGLKRDNALWIGSDGQATHPKYEVHESNRYKFLNGKTCIIGMAGLDDKLSQFDVAFLQISEKL